MVRADNEVRKLLRDIVDNPENADMVLEIIRSKPGQQISEWISKVIFHHKNFSTPEKCEIMTRMIHQFISISLREHENTAALYTAEVCMMPLEGKERSRVGYAPLSEDRIRMHEERMHVISDVYGKLEEDGIDVRGKNSDKVHAQSKKDSKTEELLLKIRKGVRNRYHALGFTNIPARFRRLDKGRWLGNQHKRVA